MERLIAVAKPIAAALIGRGETLAVAESSAGGLLSAALLAIPGASAYFLGGGVIYTAGCRHALLGLPERIPGVRSSSEPYAEILATTVRERVGSVWGLAETGAAGPNGNRHGDAAGHACIAVAGPIAGLETLETGLRDRVRNMELFALQALARLASCLEAADRDR